MNLLNFFSAKKNATDNKYKTFIQVSKTGAWEYYPGSGRLWFSDEYFTMLDRNYTDYTPFDRSALHRCWIDFLHDEDRNLAVKTFEDYLSDSAQDLYENYFRLKKQNGDYAWILSRALKMTRKNGTVEKIIGTHINISELKELENRKLEYERQLNHSRKLEALGTLSGGIAHDFNNILAAILGNTEMAKLYINDEVNQRPCLDSIESASLKGKAMVEEILNFARTDTKEYQPLTVGSIVKEVTTFISPTIPKKISLHVNINSDPEIVGDTVQLYQALINLCTNAVQAIDDNGGSIEITLEEKLFETRWQNRFVDILPGKYLKLEIKDSGKGMDEETIDKMFDPFFTTKNEKGTGLGMFLVYGIVKNHYGTISVSSAPGEGTQLTLYFPVR